MSHLLTCASISFIRYFNILHIFLLQKSLDDLPVCQPAVWRLTQVTSDPASFDPSVTWPRRQIIIDFSFITLGFGRSARLWAEYKKKNTQQVKLNIILRLGHVTLGSNDALVTCHLGQASYSHLNWQIQEKNTYLDSVLSNLEQVKVSSQHAPTTPLRSFYVYST